jgi:phenylacetate-coenzyme A ligase PaaK-like adenylate-forming protein
MQELKVDQKELEKRVKHVVSLSKEIPWYVRKYKELGIDPDEIRSPQDLFKAYEKGLYTTPEDLPELVYYKHPEAKGPFYTSGTTGKPKEIWLNPDDEKWFAPQIARAYEKRLKKSDKILSCLPSPPATSGHMVHRSLSIYGYNFLHLPPQELRENSQNFVEKYKKFNPNVLTSLTTFAYRLPLALQAFSIQPNFEAVFPGGEPSSIERRKKMGEELNGLVYDLYASAEGGIMAYEIEPFSDEHIVSLPETLVFLTRNNESVESGEIGHVLLSNLPPLNVSKPYMILLNYRIGDWAKCIEKEDNEIVTSMSEVRREAAYLAGAKLHPQEVEKAIEELEKYKKELTGEYVLIDFKTIPREVIHTLIQQGVELDEEFLKKLRNDPNTYKNWDRKAEVEIRVESMNKLQLEKNKETSKEIREKLYASNVPVKTLVESIGDARLFVEVKDLGELYKGFKKLIKPGKPKRLIVV